MKKTNLFAVLALAATPAFLHAQTTSYSDIVGYQTKTISTGLNAVGLPLLNPDLVKTSASSFTGSSVALSGETNFGSKLNSAKSYYLEVYSGSLKGDRFDLDTTATITAANGTAVLNSASVNNTYPTASIAAQLDGANIAIREHITLAQLESMTSSPLLGSSSLASSDSVAFVEGGSLVYYYKKGDGGWRRTGSSADFSTKVIPPGVGVFVKKVTSGTTLTQSGSVRDNDFARPYSSGLSLVAAGYPLDRSPFGIGVTPGAGATDWTGGTPATGDSISLIEGSSLVRYTLKPDGSLNKVGNSSDFRNAAIISATDSQFIKRGRANSDNVEIDPVP